MSVPAHDERDFEFATKYGLAVKRVIAPNVDTGDSAAALYRGGGSGTDRFRRVDRRSLSRSAAEDGLLLRRLVGLVRLRSPTA